MHCSRLLVISPYWCLTPAVFQGLGKSDLPPLRPPWPLRLCCSPVLDFQSQSPTPFTACCSRTIFLYMPRAGPLSYTSFESSLVPCMWYIPSKYLLNVGTPLTAFEQSWRWKGWIVSWYVQFSENSKTVAGGKALLKINCQFVNFQRGQPERNEVHGS